MPAQGRMWYQQHYIHSEEDKRKGKTTEGKEKRGGAEDEEKGGASSLMEGVEGGAHAPACGYESPCKMLLE